MQENVRVKGISGSTIVVSKRTCIFMCAGTYICIKAYKYKQCIVSYSSTDYCKECAKIEI